MTIEYGITYHKNLKEKYIKEFTNYFITNKRRFNFIDIINYFKSSL